jgi:hypothetical protein
MHNSPDSKSKKAETALRLARPSKINSSAAYEVMMNRLAGKYGAIVVLAVPLVLSFSSGKDGNGDIHGFFAERVRSEHELESKLQSMAARSVSKLRLRGRNRYVQRVDGRAARS